MKKRGFGVGKWNGFGGKLGDGETIKEAAVRELAEEAGVVAVESDLKEVGQIKFFFDTNPELNQEMSVFFIETWQGDIQETEEMRPQWFNKDDLPYDTMWVDDKYWLPTVLGGKKIFAEFHFTNNGEEITKHSIIER